MEPNMAFDEAAPTGRGTISPTGIGDPSAFWVWPAAVLCGMVAQIRDLAPIQKLTIAILIFVEGVVVGLSAVQTSADYGTFAADYLG
jgi:hypothetical protein